jgi:hypothetical protein
MSINFLTQKIVSVNSAGDITFMDTNGYSHHHVLRSLNNFTMNLEEVCSLKSFVAKEVVVPVSLVHNCIIECLLVGLDNIVNILSN